MQPQVLAMKPYSPGKPIEEVQREFGIDRPVKLASNENPLGPSPKAVRAIQEAAAGIHIYPTADCYRLRQKLSQTFDVPPDQLMIGNGSEELIHILGQIFLGGPEDEVVVGDPSFPRYAAATRLAGATLRPVPLDSGLRHDLSAMASQCNEKTKLVFIANPNNPTGTIVFRDDLISFLRDLPAQVVTVLDEAYFEFAAHDARMPHSLELLRSGERVIGLRTMSKAYGLAAARIGYGWAPLAIASAMFTAREPFSVSTLAQEAAIAALDDVDHAQATLRNNAKGMERLIRELETWPAIRLTPSWGNFVLVDVGQPIGPIFDQLLRQGVIVRPGNQFGIPTSMRVSIGTDEEMTRFVEAFRAVMRLEAPV